MIGKFLLMCVFGVGWLGIIAGFRELGKRIALRREDDALFRARAAELAEQQRAHARALRALPRSELSLVLKKLEESAGFVVSEEALAAEPAAPVEHAPRPTGKIVVTVRAVATGVRRIAVQLATTVRPRAIATWRSARVVVASSLVTSRRAASRVSTITRTHARKLVSRAAVVVRRIPGHLRASAAWLARHTADARRRIAVPSRRLVVVVARSMSNGSRSVAVAARTGSQRIVTALRRFANPPPTTVASAAPPRTASGTGARPALGGSLPAITSASSPANAPHLPAELFASATQPHRPPPPPSRRQPRR